MADDEGYQFWISIMGNSDDKESDFKGFSLEQINGRADESDVDLDLVVNNDQLLTKFESDSDSEQRDNENSEGSDINLTAAAAPRPRQKRQKRTSRRERDALKTNWCDRTSCVTPAKRFSGFEEDGIKVGVTHDLPVGATPFEYFSLILPREFWETFSTETNKYAAQKQTEKGVDKQWHDTSQDMQFFFFIQFIFGIMLLPETNMYWSTNPLLRIPAVADGMSRNRFNKLNQYFHLHDNTKAVPKGQPDYSSLFKV